MQNLIATLPGHNSTGQVVLMGHYDTTFGSPGALDDKSSVAAAAALLPIILAPLAAILARSLVHSSDIVVVGRTFQP